MTAPAPHRDGARPRTWLGHGAGGLFVALAAFALLVALAWVGFLGSDDVTFARGAYGWLESFPYVGGHGTIRYTITIPMALSFMLLGENEFAMVLPSLLYVVAFLAAVWFAVRGVAGVHAAFWALAALVTSPLLVVQSTIAGVDVIEMAFLFGSVFLTWRCLERGPDARTLFAAGALAGLAFLTRETALFVVPFYGLLFLAGHRFARGHYLWIAAGFLAVWCLELLYLGIMTGDPLYRFAISLNHDSTIDRSIDLAGNVIVHPLVDPLLVLAVNQEFMALFFLAVPLGAWLCFGRTIEPRLRHFARILALFGLVWLLCVGGAQSLLPLNPRYFMITAAVASILTGIGLAELLRRAGRLRLPAIGAAAVLLLGNFAGIYVENKDGLFAERLLAGLARDRPTAVLHSDPMTRYRAALLLEWGNAETRVLGSPPRAGDLYLHNPANAETPSFKLSADAIPAYRPRADWQKVTSYEPAPPLAARMIEMSGLDAALPQSVWRKLRYRHPPVTLYRLPGPATD